MLLEKALQMQFILSWVCIQVLGNLTLYISETKNNVYYIMHLLQEVFIKLWNQRWEGF